MASRYVFSEEQIQELETAAKESKKKDVDKRLINVTIFPIGYKSGSGSTGFHISCGHFLNIIHGGILFKTPN